MAATRLPDGSVVMRPSGQRAVNPVGSGTGISRPVQARGAGAGAGSPMAVNGSTRQPGRTVVARKSR